MNRHPTKNLVPPGTTGGGTDVRSQLSVLAHRLGQLVESSNAADVRRVGAAHFLVTKTGTDISDPYPDLPTLFAEEGTILVSGERGRILEWEGWVLSEDSQGAVAGPFQGFDEWVWVEARTVWRSAGGCAPGSGSGRRFVHEWRGFHFISVDPFPAAPVAFSSLEEALSEIQAIPALAPRLREA
jgi:hypothetical protein